LAFFKSTNSTKSLVPHSQSSTEQHNLKDVTCHGQADMHEKWYRSGVLSAKNNSNRERNSVPNSTQQPWALHTKIT
jgi:hypothetical protein